MNVWLSILAYSKKNYLHDFCTILLYSKFNAKKGMDTGVSRLSFRARERLGVKQMVCVRIFF